MSQRQRRSARPLIRQSKNTHRLAIPNSKFCTMLCCCTSGEPKERRVMSVQPYPSPAPVTPEVPKTPAKEQGSTSKDFGDVVLSFMENERKYEGRQKYKSIFADAPLYQHYDPKTIFTDRRNKHKVQNHIGFIDDDDNPGADNGVPKPNVQQMANHWREKTSNAKETPTVQTVSREVVNQRISEIKRRQESMREPNMAQSFAAEIAGSGAIRVLWCNMPTVVEKGLAEYLDSNAKKLQEALFEILSSEASYYRSLQVLIESYCKAPCMQPDTPGAVLTMFQKQPLFSNIFQIHSASESFLSAMEACFRRDPMLTKLGDIMYEHAEQRFAPYVTYIQNQMYQTKMLNKLLEYPEFAEAIGRIQRQPECAFVTLHSFLTLPFQRLTRLRLLTATVLKYAVAGTEVYQNNLAALAAFSILLEQCAKQKSLMEQKERLMNICQLLVYKHDTKSIATENRVLVKEGELPLLSAGQNPVGTFATRFTSIRRPSSEKACLFVFNDMLLLTKVRNTQLLFRRPKNTYQRIANRQLMVKESCSLELVSVEVDPLPQSDNITKYFPAGASSVNDPDMWENPANSDRHKSRYISTASNLVKSSSTQDLSAINAQNPVYPFRIIVHGPDDSKTVYQLHAKSLSDRERWVDVLSSNTYGVPEDLLPRVCDCPQVIAVRSQAANEKDELDLKEGDQANILVSLSDGWKKGIAPDGRIGWFSSSACVEVDDVAKKQETMKNFMMIQAAREVYRKRKEESTRFQTIRQARNQNQSDRRMFR